MDSSPLLDERELRPSSSGGVAAGRRSTAGRTACTAAQLPATTPVAIQRLRQIADSLPSQSPTFLSPLSMCAVLSKLKHWAAEQGVYLLLTFYFTALITSALRLRRDSPATTAACLGCLVGTAAVVLHTALVRAAGRPALQALTCCLTGICLAVVALTWRAIGARALLAFVPLVAAGQRRGGGQLWK